MDGMNAVDRAQSGSPQPRSPRCIGICFAGDHCISLLMNGNYCRYAEALCRTDHADDACANERADGTENEGWRLSAFRILAEV